MSATTISIDVDRVPERRGSLSVCVVAWEPSKDDLQPPEWAAIGRELGGISRCNQWWLGDWVRYGNAKFGEKYSRASKITGYDAQTLMNMVYVSSRIEISRRRESLSWSHHEAVAPLEPEMQDRWLDRAIADKFSVSDLRVELRSARRRALGEDPIGGDDASNEGTTIQCPHCNGSISLKVPSGVNLTLVS
jgi:hypothetical protein